MHMDLGMNSTLILDFTPCTKGTSRHLSDEPMNFGDFDAHQVEANTSFILIFN